MENLDALTQFCTVRQLEILEAYTKHGSQAKAAAALGIDRRNVQRAMELVRKKAALQGYSPEHFWTHIVPSTHYAKGVSTYFPKTETTPAAWVKANVRQEAYNELVKGAIAEFLEDVDPIPVAPAPLDFQTDVIPWIQIGDGHIGMLAHCAETGQNFDLKIAERELCTAIAMLIDEMPPCARIVINDLGDMTHYDNIAGKTSHSGHDLDYDGRMHKMLRVYVRTMRFIVDRCLAKAAHVDVIVNQGNHSAVNDLWMRELLEVAYGPSGRVTVLDNSNIFIPYRMGNTLVMTNHTDKCAVKDLVGVMISDFREDFGQTEFHYIDTGHVHHRFVAKEYPSVVVESWNHLAANDKYSHEMGYRSRQLITVVLRSRTFGEVGRRVLPIQEVRARLDRQKQSTTPARRAVHTV